MKKKSRNDMKIKTINEKYRNEKRDERTKEKRSEIKDEK